MSIPDIVDTRGWAWFRDLEYDVCVKAARLAREDASGWTLIDAGGGVVVDLDENGNETYSQRKVRRRRDDPHSRAAFVASPPRPSFARSFRRVAAATLIRARRPNPVAFPSCVSSPLASPLPLSHRNPLSQIEILRGERNVIVYLKRDVAYLLNRTSGDKNRPSLSDDVSFQTLMERRAPWYFRAADYIVDASGGAVESAVKTKREIKEEVLEFYYAETGEEPPGSGSGSGARSR